MQAGCLHHKTAATEYVNLVVRASSLQMNLVVRAFSLQMNLVVRAFSLLIRDSMLTRTKHPMYL